MPDKNVSMDNWGKPPTTHQKDLFEELVGRKFPGWAIKTRQGCNLAIKSILDQRAKNVDVVNMVLKEVVFATGFGGTPANYTYVAPTTAFLMGVVSMSTLLKDQAPIETKGQLKATTKTKAQQATVAPPPASWDKSLDQILIVNRVGPQ